MPSTVKFRPNKAALASMAIAVSEKDLRVRANRVLNAARRDCPVDEGRLRSSLTIEYSMQGQNPVARIGSNLPYAIFVHEGTGLFGPRGAYIYPRKATLLRWPVKNNAGGGARRRFKGGKQDQWAFAKRVAGSPGRPFLRNALPAAGG